MSGAKIDSLSPGDIVKIDYGHSNLVFIVQITQVYKTSRFNESGVNSVILWTLNNSNIWTIGEIMFIHANLIETYLTKL